MRNVNWVVGMAICWLPLAIAPAFAEPLLEVQVNSQVPGTEAAELLELTTLELVTSELVISPELDAEGREIAQVEMVQPEAIANTATLLPLGEAADLELSGRLTEDSLNAIASLEAATAAISHTNHLPEIEAIAQTSSPSNPPEQLELSEPLEPVDSDSSEAAELDLEPEIIENSPVLQRWLEEIPDVLSEIRNDPSFRTRLRLGYSQFPSSDQAGGFNVGVEDIFIGRTGLTVSADYQGTFEGDRQSYGADLRYYVRPLGSYINVAPVMGYRYLETEEYTTDDINLGLRFLLALSRTGAADLSLTQTWVAPGSSEEVGITTLSVGYAITEDLRLSTDIQKQNSSLNKDSRVGIVLEWML